MGIIAEWNIEGKLDNSYTFEVYDLDRVVKKFYKPSHRVYL